MTDTPLAVALFAAVVTKQGRRRHAEPDWAAIHRELKREHVTLTMLWDEYIERHPEGYRYSRFCDLYRGRASRLSVMREAHIGGDKLFVDYAGDAVPLIVDRLTGQVRPAQIFVAVMGASNFTYAEASWTQAQADSVGAHTRAFAALGGVPKLLVPDNTKVAVIEACLYAISGLLRQLNEQCPIKAPGGGEDLGIGARLSVIVLCQINLLSRPKDSALPGFYIGRYSPQPQSHVDRIDAEGGPEGKLANPMLFRMAGGTQRDGVAIARLHPHTAIGSCTHMRGL
jgi:hypothetical protein